MSAGGVSMEALVLCLLAFVLMGSLPLAFFRRGRLTVGWCMTAAPFLAAPLLLVAAFAGAVEPVRLPDAAPAALTLVALISAAAAIALTALTAGSHRVPLALWHQQDDAPVHIVTWGPYAWVRHPFYVAFLLMLTATAAALPHPGTLALLLVGAVQLDRTAAREERRLLASSFGAEYAAYCERTGRFLPRLRAGTGR